MPGVGWVLARRPNGWGEAWNHPVVRMRQPRMQPVAVAPAYFLSFLLFCFVLYYYLYFGFLWRVFWSCALSKHVDWDSFGLFLHPEITSFIWTRHHCATTSWPHCLLQRSADHAEAGRLGGRNISHPGWNVEENTQRMQGRIETAEEKSKGETMEAYGEEKI